MWNKISLVGRVVRLIASGVGGLDLRGESRSTAVDRMLGLGATVKSEHSVPGLVRPWCHTGTMKRMNLRDVPDDVYAALSEAASTNRQSLSAYVVDRLTEAAQVARLSDYLNGYQAADASGVSLEDAVAAVREVREAS
ncbi:MAG: hypothetical protein ACR2LX_06510 [Jatrophihabitans sp.]